MILWFRETQLRVRRAVGWRVSGLSHRLFRFPGYLVASNWFLWFALGRKTIAFRHAPILNNLLEVQAELRSLQIEIILINGTLLGAVRQRAFAGRPKDVDLIVSSDGFDRLLRNIPSIAERLGYPVRLHADQNRVHLFPRFGTEITIISPFFVDGLYPLGADDVPMICGKLSETDLGDSQTGVANLYGYEFSIPRGAEEFLVKMYGEDWRVPKGKQWGRF